MDLAALRANVALSLAARINAALSLAANPADLLADVTVTTTTTTKTTVKDMLIKDGFQDSDGFRRKNSLWSNKLTLES